MPSPELISYIESERKKKTPDDVIRSNLLANGWTNEDINAAMNLQDQNLLPEEVTRLKRYKEKVKWMTFGTLVGIDVVIIIWFKLAFNSYGVFGLSVVSVLLRLLAIYFIALASSQGSSRKDSAPKTVAKTVAGVLGSIMIIALIITGVFFVGCLFLLSGARGL